MIEIITLKGKKKKRIQVTHEPNVLSTYDSTALMKCPYIFIDQPLGIKVSSFKRMTKFINCIL